MSANRRAVNRRAVVHGFGAWCLTAALLPWSTAAQAGKTGATPGNLLVEWRVVSSAQARERRAAVDAGGISLSTLDANGQQNTVHSLMVMNGGHARLYTGRTVPVTSWQILMSNSVANGSNAGAAGSGAASGASNGAGNNATNAQLLSQTVWIDLGQGLTVHPKWSGGASLVQLEIEAQSKTPVGVAGPMGSVGGFTPDGQVQRQEVSSSLAVPLGQWVVVAQSRSQQTQSTRGTLSTTDLDDQGDQQLEIRVSTP